MLFREGDTLNKSASRHNGVVRNQINICRDTITVKFNTRHRPRGARVQCKFHASRGNAVQ